MSLFRPTFCAICKNKVTTNKIKLLATNEYVCTSCICAAGGPTKINLQRCNANDIAKLISKNSHHNNNSPQHIKNKDVDNSRTLKIQEFYVVGEKYYLNNIMKLAQSNKEYKGKTSTIIQNGNAGKKLFQYNFINKPVKLEAEPQNPHDKNAIKVIIAGELIGYIARDDCSQVKNILSKHEIKYISSFIHGGKYKIISENGDVFKDENNISIQIKIGYI